MAHWGNPASWATDGNNGNRNDSCQVLEVSNVSVGCYGALGEPGARKSDSPNQPLHRKQRKWRELSENCHQSRLKLCTLSTEVMRRSATPDARAPLLPAAPSAND